MLKFWKKRPALFWILLGIALVTRSLWLGRASYQIDESELIKIALSHKTLFDVLRTELERFTFLHRLPLPQVILRLFAALWHWSGPVPPEWLMRLPSVLFGTATVALMYGWGSVFGDRRVGLWAMTLCALSFFGVFYSREAYDYGLLIFFSTGTALSSALLMKDVLARNRFSWRTAGAYIFFSIGLLQSHLAGLLYLAPLCAFFVLIVGRVKGLDGLLKGNAPVRWLVVLGTAYFFFMPFLFKLTGGFAVTERDIARRFSLAVFAGLWGRLGWGESAVPLTLFALFWITGVFFLLRLQTAGNRTVGLFCFTQFMGYFLLQSWMLRVSRFEIRYYSPLFPLMLLFTAGGMVWIEDAFARRGRVKLAPWVRRGMALILVIWSVPNLSWILRLECRGFSNFKGIARWINENVPENGLYAFLNVYDLRGVPGTYPTSSRTGTSVTQWSSKEEHLKAKPVDQTRFFFTQFPTAFFVEVAPEDLFAKNIADDFIPREELFARHVWLEDFYYDRLVRWKTHPLGDTQINVTNQHRVLISYNRPEDLPQMARARGMAAYHYFGREWSYARDHMQRHWMFTPNSATLWLGNAAERPVRIKMTLQAAGLPGGCLVSVYHGGQLVMDKRRVPAGVTSLTIPELTVSPGVGFLTFHALPPPGHLDAAFAVHRVMISEIGGSR